MGVQEPPIRNLSSQEIYKRLWEEEQSLRESLLQILGSIDSCPEVDVCYQSISDSLLEDEGLKGILEEDKYYEDKLKKVRSTLA